MTALGPVPEATFPDSKRVNWHLNTANRTDTPNLGGLDISQWTIILYDLCPAGRYCLHIAGRHKNLPFLWMVSLSLSPKCVHYTNILAKTVLALAGVAQWIECRLQTTGSPVQFPVRACAWAAGQVPSGGCATGNHTWMFLSLSPSLPLSKDI